MHPISDLVTALAPVPVNCFVFGPLDSFLPPHLEIPLMGFWPGTDLHFPSLAGFTIGQLIFLVRNFYLLHDPGNCRANLVFLYPPFVLTRTLA